MPKEDLLRVLIEPEVKDAFFSACAAIDRKPSQMVRQFIRDWLRDNAQGDLLADPALRPRRGRK